MSMTIQQICEHAAKSGDEMDLTGCDYGPHKRSNLYLGVQPYYHFLAGFVQTLGCRTILEIGTSYGGSMMAMSRGCPADQPETKLVTIDKVDIAGQQLLDLRHIQRVHGDSLAPATVREAGLHLTSPIDLLYIDSKHSYDHTKSNILLYGAAFCPRFVILDDIHLNAEMDALWSEMSATYRNHAFDASDLAKRPGGFGVLECGSPVPKQSADPTDLARQAESPSLPNVA